MTHTQLRFHSNTAVNITWNTVCLELFPHINWWNVLRSTKCRWSPMLRWIHGKVTDLFEMTVGRSEEGYRLIFDNWRDYGSQLNVVEHQRRTGFDWKCSNQWSVLFDVSTITGVDLHSLSTNQACKHTSRDTDIHKCKSHTHTHAQFTPKVGG